MLRAGDMVGDRYRVIEEIASGGMGTLWRAHHVELDVDVALKVLSTNAASPDLLRRFKHEAQASARLRGPNIVHVLDYGVHEEQPYLAMELLHGTDLAARIARKGRLSVDHTARIVQALARAMQLAHDADIVHRDLKPANIFLEKVGDEEIVKVLDFGVAKDLRSGADLSRTTGSGVVGSPAYMSPEQVWGEKVDRRTDVWTMGVVTFEMLTGECPFADETLAKIFERIIRAPIPKIRDFDPNLPPALEAFFERALARAPADRLASARELGDAFQRALMDPPLVVEGTSTRSLRRSSPGPDLTVLAPNEGAPFAVTERPKAPPSLPSNGAASVSRLRMPLWLALIAVAVLGVFVSLRDSAPRPEPPPPGGPEARTAVAPLAAESAAREALSVVANDEPPKAGGSAASPKRAQPAVPRRASPSASPSPSTTGSSGPVDPTFGLPLRR